VTVISGATNAKQTLTDANAKNPVAVAANPTTNKIYVVNSGTNNVTVIDGAHD
jgi:DNA-binding beta-propeller fold protein YncE